MWRNLNTEYVGNINKCVAEFQIWMPDILPYEKMKIKIYEKKNHLFWGQTNVMIIRKYDNSPEGAGGYGDSIEEALIDTINYFFQMIEEDYPKCKYSSTLLASDIQYVEDSDF